MKNLKNTYAKAFIVLFALIINGLSSAHANNAANQASDDASDEYRIYDDSVEVCLLTCSPHNEVYSLYGHTALRFHDMRTGEDWAFNYGIFNFNKPFFVLRFTFGITDYELGVVPYGRFKEAYRRYGSQVTEQVLNLTPEEKEKIYLALLDNYRPENRVYRYNYFYENCTSRARDKVEGCINGKIQYARTYDTTTYRKLIHQYTQGHPWAAFGNDLCLGMSADFEIDRRKQEFLPEILMTDFAAAQIIDGGSYRPLVKETRIPVEPGVQILESEFPLTPMECAVLLLLISILIIIGEMRNKTTYKVWDTILMTVTGVAGIIILALFFSEHPTTSTNLQIFLLNPLPLFFIPAMICEGRKKKDNTVYKRSKYWKISAILLIIFFFGAFFQDYAEGMEIVALSLLTRIYSHYRYR